MNQTFVKVFGASTKKQHLIALAATRCDILAPQPDHPGYSGRLTWEHLAQSVILMKAQWLGFLSSSSGGIWGG